MIKNPKWKRDEVILALDLYFKINPSHISNKHEKITELSIILNKLPIHNEVEVQNNFRNNNSVYMKLCNFLTLDPTYPGKGLVAGSKLDKEIWDEFADNKNLLASIAESIRESSVNIIDEIDLTQKVDDEEEFSEGKILFRKHRSIERNGRVVDLAKKNAKENGSLYCEVCGFNFEEVYGNIGTGYIECHHIIPVSEYTRFMRTKVSDLALVCSNCHRMLHRKRPWMKPDKLKEAMGRYNK